jgi:hypothetical protein
VELKSLNNKISIAKNIHASGALNILAIAAAAPAAVNTFSFSSGAFNI